jgi:hypothetical protein
MWVSMETNWHSDLRASGPRSGRQDRTARVDQAGGDHLGEGGLQSGRCQCRSHRQMTAHDAHDNQLR